MSAPHQPLATVLSILPTLPVNVLAALATSIIDHIDGLDGDPDLEDDDSAGGNVEDERQAEAGHAYYPMRPLYGVDQSAGPINSAAILRDHHRRLHGDPHYATDYADRISGRPMPQRQGGR